MGQPVAGNPTQYMMEKAFARAGLEWRYLTLEVAPEELSDAIRGMRAMGFRGANFLAPHQTAVVEHLDELGDVAKLLGAVNCVSRQGDALVGENTVGKGVVEALGGVSGVSDRRVAVVGGGGAAAAIAAELTLAGAAEVTVVSRTEPTGEKMPVPLVVVEDDYEVPDEVEILINITPGAADGQETGPTVDVATLREDLIVADVGANPPQTKLLGEAAERGCRTIDGLDVLVGQTVAHFKIWTGAEPDVGVMRDALEEFFGL